MGLFREQVGRLFRGRMPGLQPPTMPASTSDPSLVPMPAKAPGSMPKSDPPEVPRSTPSLAPKQSLFPITDSNGMIIRLSPKPGPRDLGARDHGEFLFEWLSMHIEYAGSSVLARLLPQVYVAFCSEHGLDPFPWRSIATVLKGFTGRKKYAWVREGKRRRRLRIYQIPDRRTEEDYYHFTPKHAAA